MPVIGELTWESDASVGDPAFKDLRAIVSWSLLHGGAALPGYAGGAIFHNEDEHLPVKADGYYREYDAQPLAAGARGPQRIVIGRSGDVWITPDHYTHNWVRVQRLPM